MSGAHAILSPSSAQRWLTCTPSARLEETFPDTTSEAAAEGTVAHELCELMLRKAMKEITGVKFNRALAKIKESKYYCGEMQECADSYVEFVMELYAEALSHTRDAVMEIEERLDLTDFVPEGFGTGDNVIIADGTLHITDLKYGKGVLVDAGENKQMMIYALGALAKYDFLYDIREVVMTIYQPRLRNITSFVMTAEALREWRDTELKPKAKIAFEGKGDFVVGPHCLFCRAKPVCKAHAKHQMELAKYDFKEADLLTPKEVADILDRAKDFMSWIRSVSDYSLIQAVNHGVKYPGYKLVEGRSNRKFSDEEKVKEVLKLGGIKDEDIYNVKLQGITHFEKLLGKAGFSEMLGNWVIKPEGAPTLVPDYDKRPEIGSNEQAAKDFTDN